MNTKLLITAVLGLIIGAGGGYMAGANRYLGYGNMAGSSVMHGGKNLGMNQQMDSMLAGLSGKTGDEFDKAFISEMIVHHEGAVIMAQAALVHAKHQEIKDLAKAIITAQTTEIQQMRAWQASWYGVAQ